MDLKETLCSHTTFLKYHSKEELYLLYSIYNHIKEYIKVSTLLEHNNHDHIIVQINKFSTFLKMYRGKRLFYLIEIYIFNKNYDTFEINIINERLDQIFLIYINIFTSFNISFSKFLYTFYL